MAKKIKDIMTKEVVSTSVPGTRDDVLKKIHSENISCVPIVKQGSDKLKGIITRSDLLHGGEEEQIALLMTRDPKTINKDGTIQEAVQILIKNDIRRLPVVNNGDLVGIISVADLIGEIKTDKDISGLYSKQVPSLWEGTPINVAAVSLKLGQNDSAVVLNDEGMLSGILSDTDLVKSATINDYVRSSKMGTDDEDDKWTWEGFQNSVKIYHGISRLDFPKEPISKIMTKQVTTKYAKSTASEAAKSMVENKIEQLPIVNQDNEVIGLLNDKNLVPLLL